MPVLTIGRVGLDDADIDRVNAFRQVNDYDEQALRLEGWLRSTSLTATNAIRNNLLGIRPGTIIPITWTEDPEVDGWYVFRFADMQMNVEDHPLANEGLIPFVVIADHLGLDSQVQFQSRLTGTVRQNDFSITSTSTRLQPFIGTPVGSEGFYVGLGNEPPSPLTRTSTAGAVKVYASPTLYTQDDPWWDSTPSGYYDGDCYLKVDSYVRLGKRIPNSATDWEIGNSLVRVSPNSGTSGYLDFEAYNGSTWETAKVLKLYSAINVSITQFTDISVVRNEPHIVSIRLKTQLGDWGFGEDALGETTVLGAGQEIFAIDVTLRRGSRFVEIRYTKPTATQQGLVFEPLESLTPFSVTGTTSNVGAVTSSTSHTYVLGTSKTILYSSSTAALSTSGGIFSQSTGTGWDAYAGFVLNGASASTGDTKEDLAYQYLGGIAQEVRPIPR